MNIANTDKAKICVFASSSDNLEKEYYKDAAKLGELIARSGCEIVYGGSELGLMGALTNSAHALGCKITGVMPEKLYNLGIWEGNCSEFILTRGMRDRKAKMDELSNCIIALPGGFGTVEELSEMIVQKQLGYSNKPIALLNTLGYWDELIEFFNKVIEKRFAPELCKNLYYVAKTPNDALEYILNYNQAPTDYLKDKIKIKAAK